VRNIEGLKDGVDLDHPIARTCGPLIVTLCLFVSWTVCGNGGVKSCGARYPEGLKAGAHIDHYL
jgi:hypothetical protein